MNIKFITLFLFFNLLKSGFRVINVTINCMAMNKEKQLPEMSSLDLVPSYSSITY